MISGFESSSALQLRSPSKKMCAGKLNHMECLITSGWHGMVGWRWFWQSFGFCFHPVITHIWDLLSIYVVSASCKPIECSKRLVGLFQQNLYALLKKDLMLFLCALYFSRVPEPEFRSLTISPISAVDTPKTPPQTNY